MACMYTSRKSGHPHVKSVVGVLSVGVLSAGVLFSHHHAIYNFKPLNIMVLSRETMIERLYFHIKIF